MDISCKYQTLVRGERFPISPHFECPTHYPRTLLHWTVALWNGLPLGSGLVTRRNGHWEALDPTVCFTLPRRLWSTRCSSRRFKWNLLGHPINDPEYSMKRFEATEFSATTVHLHQPFSIQATEIQIQAGQCRYKMGAHNQSKLLQFVEFEVLNVHPNGHVKQPIFRGDHQLNVHVDQFH